MKHPRRIALISTYPWPCWHRIALLLILLGPLCWAALASAADAPPASPPPPAIQQPRPESMGDKPAAETQNNGAESADGTLQDKPPALNLGDLLPQSQDPPSGPALMMTDKPAVGRAAKPSPQEQTSKPPAARPANTADKPAAQPRGQQQTTTEEGKPAQPHTPAAPDKPGAPQASPKPAPKPGDKLSIPEGAAQNQDLSFLKGCWVNVTTVYEQSEQKVRTVREYCFDERGGGVRTITEQDGQRRICRGTFNSRFDEKGTLVITSGSATCPGDPSYYLPDSLRCTGTGDSTRCTGFGHDPGSGRNWQWQADFKRR